MLARVHLHQAQVVAALLAAVVGGLRDLRTFWKKYGAEVCKVNQTKEWRYDAAVYVSNEQVNLECFWNNNWWLSYKDSVQQPPGSVLVILETCGSSKVWAEILRHLQYNVTERCDLSIADQIEYMHTAKSTMSLGEAPLAFAAKAHNLKDLRILSMGLWWADWWIDC